eukprot:TRINITY_DN36_c3_g1_i1.p1 TRINITY_DN36_c3_g1~~TRINITY_DN36_c3_g1_i1.p1  ORF type:complete len:898 (+),score=230.94 TRINITY_DN36_c3_g1_i1:272-2695(+)
MNYKELQIFILQMQCGGFSQEYKVLRALVLYGLMVKDKATNGEEAMQLWFSCNATVIMRPSEENISVGMTQGRLLLHLLAKNYPQFFLSGTEKLDIASDVWEECYCEDLNKSFVRQTRTGNAFWEKPKEVVEGGLVIDEVSCFENDDDDGDDEVVYKLIQENSDYDNSGDSKAIKNVDDNKNNTNSQRESIPIVNINKSRSPPRTPTNQPISKAHLSNTILQEIYEANHDEECKSDSDFDVDNDSTMPTPAGWKLNLSLQSIPELPGGSITLMPEAEPRTPTGPDVSPTAQPDSAMDPQDPVVLDLMPSNNKSPSSESDDDEVAEVCLNLNDLMTKKPKKNSKPERNVKKDRKNSCPTKTPSNTFSSPPQLSPLTHPNPPAAKPSFYSPVKSSTSNITAFGTPTNTTKRSNNTSIGAKTDRPPVISLSNNKRSPKQISTPTSKLNSYDIHQKQHHYEKEKADATLSPLSEISESSQNTSITPPIYETEDGQTVINDAYAVFMPHSNPKPVPNSRNPPRNSVKSPNPRSPMHDITTPTPSVSTMNSTGTGTVDILVGVVAQQQTRISHLEKVLSEMESKNQKDVKDIASPYRPFSLTSPKRRSTSAHIHQQHYEISAPEDDELKKNQHKNNNNTNNKNKANSRNSSDATSPSLSFIASAPFNSHHKKQHQLPSSSKRKPKARSPASTPSSSINSNIVQKPHRQLQLRPLQQLPSTLTPRLKHNSTLSPLPLNKQLKAQKSFNHHSSLSTSSQKPKRRLVRSHTALPSRSSTKRRKPQPDSGYLCGPPSHLIENEKSSRVWLSPASNRI